MQIGSYISLALVLGAIYFLGQVGYRLSLSVRKLKQNQAKLDQNLKLLEQPIERAFAKAEPSSSKNPLEVIQQRQRFLRAREHRVNERRRRLIQRLQTGNLDKR